MNVPNPDGLVSDKPNFNFTRLGIRVPTILISPWINKGTVIHKPDGIYLIVIIYFIGPTKTSEYTTTSIIATLKE